MTETTEDVIERRKDFRIDMEEEIVDIEWSDANGEKLDERIQCLDFSKGGLKIQFSQNIPIHATVTITFQKAHPNSQTLKAKVIRSIEQAPDEFHIALRMID